MFFALGVLVASLLALAIAPAFWWRAIRLSKRRLEMQLPLSPEEILAGRDLLRAEFAVERRQLEQKAEALNRVHADDMAELGRRAVIIDAQDAGLRSFSEQGGERGAEIMALQRALAETSTELAATAKESYDVSGLLARKDVQIQELGANLKDIRTLAAEQKTSLMALESKAAALSEALARQTERSERLAAELSTLQLQHQADQVTLKTAAVRVADREEALETAVKREKELIRHRQLQAETRAPLRRAISKRSSGCEPPMRRRRRPSKPPAGPAKVSSMSWPRCGRPCRRKMSKRLSCNARKMKFYVRKSMKSARRSFALQATPKRPRRKMTSRRTRRRAIQIPKRQQHNVVRVRGRAQSANFAMSVSDTSKLA